MSDHSCASPELLPSTGIAGNPADRRAARVVILAGLVLGLGWFGYYYAVGLTTAHYDAKAHLMVARRIFDSSAPGYLQMGAHWLPLLHLVYLPLVIFEAQYRTGMLPSLISVFSYALSGWLLFRIALRATGRQDAGLLASAIFLGNANWQYLQSCPLTEPLYAALSLLAVDRLIAWRERPDSDLPLAPAAWTALAALCRYEGWLLLGGVLLLLLIDWYKGSLARPRALRAIAEFVSAFAIPVLAHFGYLFAHTGESFFHRVARGNPDPYFTFKRPILSTILHFGELAQVAALVPLVFAIGGIVYSLLRLDRAVRWLPLYLLWLPSLLNIAALYWGLIYRVRYSALLVPAVALFAALLCLSPGALRRAFTAAVLVVASLPWLTAFFPRDWEYRATFPGPGVLVLPLIAALVFLWARTRRSYFWPSLALCVAGMQLPVLYVESRPILAETREHDYIEAERQAVLRVLRRDYDGSRVLIDIARLAPLIYDSGIAVREFIYNEGRQEEWVRALRNPGGEAGWIVIEKGDELWNLSQVDPHWADMYALAVQTESYRLYRLHRIKVGSDSPARQPE